MAFKAPLVLAFLKSAISKELPPWRGNASDDASQEKGPGRPGMAANILEQRQKPSCSQWGTLAASPLPDSSLAFPGCQCPHTLVPSAQ